MFKVTNSSWLHWATPVKVILRVGSSRNRSSVSFSTVHICFGIKYLYILFYFYNVQSLLWNFRALSNPFVKILKWLLPWAHLIEMQSECINIAYFFTMSCFLLFYQDNEISPEGLLSLLSSELKRELPEEFVYRRALSEWQTSGISFAKKKKNTSHDLDFIFVLINTF